MKVYLSHDEYYPLFAATTEREMSFLPKQLGFDQDDEVELTDEEFADYRRVREEFAAWQRKLRGLYRWDETQS